MPELDLVAIEAKLDEALGSTAAAKAVSGERAKQLAEELAGELESAADTLGTCFGAWSCGEPSVSGNIATITVSAPDSSSPSLWQEGYPSGATSLIDLLDEGYDTGDKAVFGEWKGKKIRSRTSFDGVHALEPAVEGFKRGHPEVIDVEFQRTGKDV